MYFREIWCMKSERKVSTSVLFSILVYTSMAFFLFFNWWLNETHSYINIDAYAWTMSIFFFIGLPFSSFWNSSSPPFFFLRTNRADVVGVEREIWVSDERADERKKRGEKSRRSPSSLIGSSPPGRTIVCTNIHTRIYIRCVAYAQKHINRPFSSRPANVFSVFLSLLRLPSFLSFKIQTDIHKPLFFVHRSIDTRTSNRVFCRQRSPISLSLILLLSFPSHRTTTKNWQTPYISSHSYAELLLTAYTQVYT